MPMMDDIPDCAAKVVNVLSHVEQLRILSLAETLEERSLPTYQALGWLAREGRVRYTQAGTRVVLSFANPKHVDGNDQDVGSDS
jgi:hypothetical protein